MSSDLPLRLVVSPDGKLLLAACGGYNNTGLAVLSLADKRVTKFFPLPEVFNGLAFSKDGRRVFVSGGDSGVLHVFDYQGGQLSPGKPVRAGAEPAASFLAGIAVHPQTGKLYVCNEGNHEVWTVDPESLAPRGGRSPWGCTRTPALFGADQRHLYVSNWGSRSVSVIDTQPATRPRHRRGHPAQRHGPFARRPALRGLCGRQHGPRHPDAGAGKGGAGRQPRAPPAGGHAGDPLHVALPGLARREHARRAWPSRPTARRCMSPTPTTTTSWSPTSPTARTSLADSRASFRWAGIPTALAVVADSRTLLVANGKGVRSRPSCPAGARRPSRGESACRSIIPAISSRARSRWSPARTPRRWPLYGSR